ncbi:MAG: PEP-CTERM system histidine kinase PrsK [Pseudomonadota bacterium]|nr:PEP-CTERM system histidine kinase PrsK [Pseudomonadota bacterium]
MDLTSTLLLVCAATYATLSALIAIQARKRTNAILAACCGVTSVWAAVGAIWPQSTLGSTRGLLDLARILAWYIYLLHLYQRFGVGSRWQVRSFTAVAVGSALLGAFSLWPGIVSPTEPLSLFSLPIAIRLTLSVCELLLIENLYLNLPEHTRWHVAMPCVLLGGLACFDILVSADSVLFHRPSPPLSGARAVAMVIVAPLLVIAATRGQRWSEPIRLSRTAVFHSATLVLSGSVLLALAMSGEVLRQFNGDWGWVAEVSLVFSGLIGLVLFLSSRSARSLMHRLVVHHFFADRYDYRRQWLDCIATLSGPGTRERTALHIRAIRAVADVIDSPNGALFLREGSGGPFAWAGSWNMPAGSTLLADHPLVEDARGGEWVVDLSRLAPELLARPPLQALGRVWLAIPLLHAAGMIGVVIAGPPRVPFRTDQEVFDLLRIIGREVATYIAEQRATEVMLQTRNLHDYSKRFAFVAHDIKNVSSQLALLLSNAGQHISNPEFQRDMLDTVQSSVTKIDGLLKRLDEPAADPAPAAITPVPRLEALLATYQRVRKARLSFEHDGSTGKVAMSPDAFDTAVTHLLNNAVEASPGQAVQIRVRHEASRIAIEIIDHGSGMSPAFIRDELFQPFKTNKQGGSGIGAFQARELLREAGGELVVISEQGIGTTMRIMLARADQMSQAHIGQAA